MSVMDKFLNYMKLNGDEDDEYYDDEYLDDEEDMEPAPKKSGSSKAKDTGDYEDAAAAKKTASGGKITPISKPVKRMNNGGGMEVCVIKPTSVEDAREITETLLANRTVVLNLEGLDVDVAQRIIDFTSGSCFAIGGNGHFRRFSGYFRQLFRYAAE